MEKEKDTVRDLRIALKEVQNVESTFNVTKNEMINIAKHETDFESTSRVSQKLIQIVDEALVTINLESENKLSQIEFLINAIIKMRNTCVEEITGSKERLAVVRTTASNKIMVKNALTERASEIKADIAEIQSIAEKIDDDGKWEMRKVGHRPEKMRNIRNASRKSKKSKK